MINKTMIDYHIQVVEFVNRVVSGVNAHFQLADLTGQQSTDLSAIGCITLLDPSMTTWSIVEDIGTGKVPVANFRIPLYDLTGLEPIEAAGKVINMMQEMNAVKAKS